MMGQFGAIRIEIVGVRFLERHGHAAVQQRAPRDAEPLVDRVADQRVRERVVPHGARPLLDHACVQRLVERLDELIVVEVACVREDRPPEVTPRDGRDRQHAVCTRAESSDPAPDHALDPFGDAHLAGLESRRAQLLPAVGGAGLLQVAQHLHDEERVALGLLEDRPVERARRIAGVRAHEPRDRLARSRRPSCVTLEARSRLSRRASRRAGDRASSSASR